MRFNEIEWMVGKIWKVDLPDSEVCTEKTYALILASYYRNVATNDKRKKMLPNFLRYISEKCDVSKTRVVNNNNSRILNVFFIFHRTQRFENGRAQEKAGGTKGAATTRDGSATLGPGARPYETWN